MEKTIIRGCRVIHPDSGEIVEQAVFTLEHKVPDKAPDAIGVLMDENENKIDLNHLASDEVALDMENTTVIPGLIDLDAGLLSVQYDHIVQNTLSTYRNVARALNMGMTACGIMNDQKGIAAALGDSLNNDTLWGPYIKVLDGLPQHDNYHIFCGLPQPESDEEIAYIQQVKRVKALGKKPAVATGVSPSNGEPLALIRAAQLLVKGGYDNMEAIAAITYNNAFLLGLHHNIGRVDTGYFGDFIALKENPLDDIAALGKCVLASRGGRLIYSKLKGFNKSNLGVVPPGYSL